MTVTRTVADREQQARDALAEVTRPGDVGPYLDTVEEGGGVLTLHFAANMPGYPGWRWTVSLAELEGEEPTVLETELLPGDGALLAPDWVPWSERLEEWRAQQASEAVESADDDAPAGADDAAGDDDDDADEADDDLGDDVYDGLDPEAAAGLDEDDPDDESGADDTER